MPLDEEGGSPQPSCWFCGVVEATSCSSAIACASWIRLSPGRMAARWWCWSISST